MILEQRKLIFVAASLLVGLVACEKANKSEQTQTTGANEPEKTEKAGNEKTMQQPMAPDANDPTIDRITNASCQREMACDRIGQGKKWADQAACRSDLRASARTELARAECPNVQMDKVQACIAALATENCDSVAMGPKDVQPCTKEVLCKTE